MFTKTVKELNWTVGDRKILRDDCVQKQREVVVAQAIEA